jgi:two-component system sensor histidine kinase CiaH
MTGQHDPGEAPAPARTPAPDRTPDATADARLLRRVRWQLVAFSGGATLLVLLVLGALVYWTVSRTLSANSVSQLEDRSEAIADVVSGGRPLDPGLLSLAFGGRGSGTIAYVIDPQGGSIGPQGLAVVGLPDEKSIAAARATGRDVRIESVADVPVRVYSQTAVRNGRQFVVQIVADRTAEANTLTGLLAVLLIGGLGAVVLAAVAGFAYAGRALIPIRDSLRRQREFAADASHELRTPLAVIRTSVEHLRRHPRKPVESVGTALEDIEAEVGRLTHLVDDLLLLARADSGAIELEHRPLDLADVAADAVAPLAQLASERKVALVLDPEPAPAVGDPGRLGQVVGILVDNAVRHSPPDGKVLVRTRTERDGASVVVEDEGPGIAAEDAERVFDRFWRAPGAPEGGTGLGLAIARWVVERHGGSIVVDPSSPHGARFTVRLPA